MVFAAVIHLPVSVCLDGKGISVTCLCALHNVGNMVFVTHSFLMVPLLTTVFVRMDGGETVVRNVGHIGIAPIRMTPHVSNPTSVSAMEQCLTPMAYVVTPS